jgi:hypothetical protein
MWLIFFIYSSHLHMWNFIWLLAETEASRITSPNYQKKSVIDSSFPLHNLL